MNKGLIAGLAFIFGAGAGSFVTYKLVKNRFEEIADEEIESVKELYSRKEKELEENLASEEAKEKAAKNRDKGDIMEYAKKISENRYGDINVPEPSVGPIKVIDERELGEVDDYDIITLYYYSDGVLADNELTEVEDAIDKVGVDYVDEFENSDVVYVRNDDYQAYYEIIKKDSTFYEAAGDDED